MSDKPLKMHISREWLARMAKLEEECGDITVGGGAAKRPLLWKLDDQGIPVPCTARGEWGAWMESHTPQRVVGNDERDGVRVSTIFIGIDAYGAGRLWETMVFGGAHHREQERYSSQADAVAGHRLMCDQVFGHDE